MDGKTDPRALQSLLDYHVEAGVDCALDETPHDRFAEDQAEAAARSAPAPRSPEEPRPPVPAPAPTVRGPSKAAAAAPEAAARAARDQVKDARSLEELESLLAAF